jgi:hypothetical protein
VTYIVGWGPGAIIMWILWYIATMASLSAMGFVPAANDDEPHADM